MKFALTALFALAAFGSFAITATKAYVDGATNAVLAAANAHADAGSNATWAAIADATNAVPRIVSGIREIKANCEATVESPIGSWTPSEYPHQESRGEFDDYYDNIFFNSYGWRCVVHYFTGEEWISYDEEMGGDYSNTNATTLYFPDGTPTYRIIHTSLATTNDVVDLVVRATNDASIVRGVYDGSSWNLCVSSAKQLLEEDYARVYFNSDRTRLLFEDIVDDLFTIAFTNDIPSTNGLARASDIPTTAAQVGAYPAMSGNQLAYQVSAISTHLNAEDARFVSTNYDSVVRVPEAFVEIKISNTWLTVWKEMTRWNRWTGTNFTWDAWCGFDCWRTNVDTQLSWKADRAWGTYDSETGGYSPEGYTQISSSNILIAAGMAYQRTVTSAGSVWILRCNSGSYRLGGNTNGYFQVVDSKGNVNFEIVNGEQEELGANADGITVDNSTTPPTVIVPYSVEATEHPTIQICDNLSTAQWKPETDADCLANVTWTGTSGEYVARVQRKTSGAGIFVTATYLGGSMTYIRNAAPVSMDSILLNGTRYYLGTATVGGHTVLTLSTTMP